MQENEISRSASLASHGNFIIDLNELDRVSNRGSEVDRFLMPHLQALKSMYKRFGDPYSTYWTAHVLADRVKELPAASTSFQYSRLLALMAEMLVAEGKDQPRLILADSLLQQASQVLYQVDSFSDEIIKTYIKFALHACVAQKALGKFDDGIKRMRDVKESLRRKVDVPEPEFIMLTRQEVIMHQDPREHARLFAAAEEYVRTSPVEYYATIKRIFEFAMNRRMNDAKTLFPEFQRAFSAVRHRMPRLSHVSFAKNVGQFRLIQGQTEKATSILKTTLMHALALNFHGQQRQIHRLLDEAMGGAARGLQTFRVV